MNTFLERLTSKHLQWLPEVGVGYIPTPEGQSPYDKAYFEKYQSYEDTDIGKALNAFRELFVKSWVPEPRRVLDIGIGCGTLLSRFENGKGYDVNPAAKEWLRSSDRYCSPYDEDCDLRDFDAFLFFDSLEHLQNPDELLKKLLPGQRVIVSIPIFRNARHILESKHYRPDEHVWYFSSAGLRRLFSECGFDCLATSDGETRVGREDILTFAFEKRAGEEGEATT